MTHPSEIGKLIVKKAYRDAIHVAIAPVVAGELLSVGQRVRLRGGKAVAANNNISRDIGIVDPFLPFVHVQPGQRFWLFLHPGTIEDLRHEWSHPAFENSVPELAPADPEKMGPFNQSVMWLKSFAEDKAEITFGELMEGIAKFVEDDKQMCDGGKWMNLPTPPELWLHYQLVTGTPLDRVYDDHDLFTCEC